MELEIVNTKDGSKSIFSKVFDAAYHSWYGAITESKHIYIENGLAYKHRQGLESVKVLEVGYGTGLNALLSGVYALENNLEVIYSAIDKYEVPKELIDELNYTIFFDAKYKDFLRHINNVQYDSAIKIHEYFTLIKALSSLKDTTFKQNYDVIYFDAFSPRRVPYMWTVEVMKQMYEALKSGGILVTFCTQNQFKLNLAEAGFEVESIPGSTGKIELTRGIRTK